MNNWGKFAEMLGLEFGQEFELIDVYDKIKYKNTYKIEEDGLLLKLPTFKWAICELSIIEKILNGEVKVVPKEPWKPKKRGTYWHYDDVCDGATYFKFEGNYYDLLLWKVGNCFKTREEAEANGKEIMEQIRKEYEEA